jgi:dipeptidyl aminopeptidase/acylaminoacyl peptidase
MKSTTLNMRILVIAMFLLSALQGMAQQRAFTPLDIAKIQNVGAVQISPDARHVAYTLSVPADPLTVNAPNSTHLYVADVATGTATALITSGGGIGNVSFRPQSGTITFTSRREGDAATSLYEIPVSGGEPVRLLTHVTNILGYQFAADGNHVIFMANEVLNLPENPLPYQPILFEQNRPNRKAYLQNVSVEGHPAHLIDIPGSAYNAVFSPDRSHIAISAAPTPEVDDQYMAQTIHIVRYQGREVIASLANEGKLGSIHWSPDGTRLALVAGNDIHDPIDGRLMIVSVEDGAKPVNILPDFEGKIEQIRWSDANTIHMIVSEGVNRAFATVRPDGSRFTRVIAPGGPMLTAFSVANDGTIAFAANTSTHPSEVYVYKRARRNTWELTRLTNVNPWFSEMQFARQDVVRYPARDGAYTIEGILFYPLNYESGKTYPLITVVHGGPEAHYSNGWLMGYSTPGHFGAAEGYFVFMPNYRGSTGRGLAFAMSSQADLAGKEFDDIVDGVDYLIAQGLVDRDRVGVTGGSYGGYATAWMSTYYSERFAAGVMFVGISNNISKWGTSDIPEELYLVHARKRLWDDWMDKLRSSPIYYVDRAQTPLLIMHGANDTRVHPAQSMELFRHIKVRKPEVPVELVLYPGEGHGNTRSTSRYDYNLRMIEWFNRYLK